MKRREMPAVKISTTILTLFWGALKAVQLFGRQNFMLNKNLLEPQFLKHYQEKLVVTFFFEKGYVRKRAKNQTL